jgi:hypothetical protein
MESELLSEALDAFERGLALSPGQPALRLHRAQCLRRLGRWRHHVGRLRRLPQRPWGNRVEGIRPRR